MVNKKRRIAFKAGVGLIIVMLFFTFFSSSINYFITPKVTISLARHGSIIIGQEYVSGIIIPSSAVIDGSFVYVVSQADTFLGTQLHIDRRRIVIETRDFGQAVVSDGLTNREYIVTSWDRPLKDGQRVILPND